MYFFVINCEIDLTFKLTSCGLHSPPQTTHTYVMLHLPPCPPLPLHQPRVACAASSVTVASTPAATCAHTCASTPWTNPSSAASATVASASPPRCATTCVSTRANGPTSVTCARARTRSWPACARIRRAPDTDPTARTLRPDSRRLLQRRCQPFPILHCCVTSQPWCSETHCTRVQILFMHFNLHSSSSARRITQHLCHLFKTFHTIYESGSFISARMKYIVFSPPKV